ncbi:MAG: ComEC/Rec2 family competence protein [Pyrinomonadaceae bacterium]
MPQKKSKPNFTLNPLLWLAASFAVGIISALWLSTSNITATLIIVAFGGLAIILRARREATFLILIAFSVLGSVSYQNEIKGVASDRLRRLYDEGIINSGDPVEIEGVLSDEPEPAPDGYFLSVKASRLIYKGEERAASGITRLFLPISDDNSRADVSALDLKFGDRVLIACRLEREDRYLNPGVAPRKQILDRQHIDARGMIKSPLLVEKTGRDPVFIPLEFVLRKRVAMIERFRKTFSPSTAGILIASILGNKHFLDKRTADIFREGGTFHVLVISGLHITFIGGLILLIVRGFTRNRRIQALIVVSCLWLYGIAVGGDAPVIRACVMFTILMIGYASYRTATLLNSLGACALILLVWRPSDLFDPSFQLTFVSVSAIVGFGIPMIEKLKAIGKWTPSTDVPFPPNVPTWLRSFCETVYWNPAAWDIERDRQIWSAGVSKSPFFNRLDDFGIRRMITFIFEGILISLSVQIWLLPLLVYYFHRVSLVSIPLNLWVGSVMAVESIAAVAAVLIGSVSTVLAAPFVAVTEMLNWFLINAPSVLTDTTRASIRVPIYDGEFRAIYLLYFVPVIAASILVFRWDAFSLERISIRSKFAFVLVASSLAITAAMILFHPYSSPKTDGRLTVEFLDVGQGDAAFITFPSGTTMLVDAGGRMNYKKGAEDEIMFEPDVPRIGEAVVSEFLWERGISRVDTIVATHADADHIQGLSDVAKNFQIGNAYFGRMNTNDPGLTELLTVLDRFGVPQSAISAGDAFEIDGVRLEILNPLENETGMSANNDSVVLRLTFGEVSFLLTGDIERETEMRLANSGNDLRSTVLKVPHHGSRSSSALEFVDAVKPKFAIISVGRHSIFGHPHKEVVERWKAIDADVLTTGERGTISFTTDGKLLSLERFK